MKRIIPPPKSIEKIPLIAPSNRRELMKSTCMFHPVLSPIPEGLTHLSGVTSTAGREIIYENKFGSLPVLWQ